MKKAVILLALCAASAGAQSPSAWTHTQHVDQLRGTSIEQYVLPGKFLTAPSNAKTGDFPSLVVRCAPDPKVARGHVHGKFSEGFISVGSVIDSGVFARPGRVRVEIRRDGGKLQDDEWEASTNYLSVFFSSVSFNNLLYGHMIYHKEGTSPQTEKLVIGLQEYLGGEVVMEFDLPDSAEVADACGTIWHK